MKKALFFDTYLEAYHTTELENTLTAGKLANLLAELDPDTPVYIRHVEDIDIDGYHYNGFIYDEVAPHTIELTEIDDDE